MFMGINPENPTSFEEIAESVAKAIRGERESSSPKILVSSISMGKW